MLPQYTFALGSTDAIKKIIEWLESQPAIAKTIKEKEIAKDPAV